VLEGVEKQRGWDHGTLAVKLRTGFRNLETQPKKNRIKNRKGLKRIML
jgi:hypothetical protein